MRKRKHARPTYVYHYTLMDVMMASPVQPLPEQSRVHQLTRMHQGLAAMEKSPSPTTEDWRVVSDAVNLMETLITKGPWHDCTGELVFVSDNKGLLSDAVAAMAMAGKRSKTNGTIRLDGAGIQAVRGLLEDYGVLLEELSARAMIQAHRETERRIHAILTGKNKPHDVEIMDL